MAAVNRKANANAILVDVSRHAFKIGGQLASGCINESGDNQKNESDLDGKDYWNEIGSLYHLSWLFVAMTQYM